MDNTFSVSRTDTYVWWSVETGMTSVPEAEVHFGFKPIGISNTTYISTVQSIEFSFHVEDSKGQDKWLFVGDTVNFHFETQ